MRQPFTVITAILTTVVIKTGVGIKRYVCNSKQDHRCSDPFKNNSILDIQSVNCTRDPSSSKSALETVGNLLTRLGQTPHDNSNARPTQTGVTPHVPTSCQKLDLRVMGELVTERGCAGPFQNKLNPCDAIKLLTTLELEFCGFCNSDNCNPASCIDTSPIGLTSPILFIARRLL